MPDYLKQIFLFNQDAPLIFTQMYFWGFFLVVLLFYSFLYKSKPVRNTYLWLVSMFFYYKTGGLFLFILVFCTLADFYIGHAIYRSRTKSGKKGWLALSLASTLLILAFFKYDIFFTETINSLFNTHFHAVNHAASWSNIFLGTRFDIGKLLPPVGISFFTFQKGILPISLGYYWLLMPNNIPGCWAHLMKFSKECSIMIRRLF